MASCDLNNNDVEPNLHDNLFSPEILGKSSSLNPTLIMLNFTKNHSSHFSHDEDDPSIQVSNEQLMIIVKELEGIQQIVSQEHLVGEVVPLIENIRMLIQGDEHGVDFLRSMPHTMDENTMKMASCMEVLGYFIL